MSIIKLIFKNKISYSRQESIAFSLWLASLNKKGYPKGQNGEWLNTWELYDYFTVCPERDIYLKHAGK